MKRNAFTLVELLVAITIILILISMLLPAVTAVKDKGRMLQCMNNQVQLAKAVLIFGDEHRQILPATMKNGTESWQITWLGKELFSPGDPSVHGTWPMSTGALVMAYVKDAGTIRRLARCPSMRTGTLRSGVGSNGFFDYSMLESFGGANYTRIPSQAEVYYGSVTNRYPTPMVVEESPFLGINGNNIEPSHGNSDKLNFIHAKGRLATYAAADGSGHAVDNKGLALDKMPAIKEWTVNLSGTRVSLWINSTYGAWNNL